MTDPIHDPADKPQPKLHIDSDWKAQAAAEKQKLAEQAKAAEEEQGPGGLPPADFRTLISTMVTQALMSMGAIPDPMTNRRMVHLELAKHHIDMLGVVQEKTKGNLNAEEQELIDQVLHELRLNFTELARQVMAHQAKMAAGGAPAKDKPAAGPGPKPGGPGPIIAP